MGDVGTALADDEDAFFIIRLDYPCGILDGIPGRQLTITNPFGRHLKFLIYGMIDGQLFINRKNRYGADSAHILKPE